MNSWVPACMVAHIWVPSVDHKAEGETGRKAQFDTLPDPRNEIGNEMNIRALPGGEWEKKNNRWRQKNMRNETNYIEVGYNYYHRPRTQIGIGYYYDYGTVRAQAWNRVRVRTGVQKYRDRSWIQEFGTWWGSAGEAKRANITGELQTSAMVLHPLRKIDIQILPILFVTGLRSAFKVPVEGERRNNLKHLLRLISRPLKVCLGQLSPWRPEQPSSKFYG
ncbi:hypothetical protein B0H13DRAFT_1895121 [Mycena leptocephala]|nr:hypothetical protein B0H13DRAFT_1895121 [Mycena leptocephala]